MNFHTVTIGAYFQGGLVFGIEGGLIIGGRKVGLVCH